jgi:16S rRNA (guanine966-N2)-methyltransferase
MRVIAGKFRNLTLKAGDNFRPTSDRVRETLFNILQSDIQGTVFVDGFCGSGAVGIEALSRGASKVYFVENNRRALEILEHNLTQCCEGEKWRIFSLPVTKGLDLVAREAQPPDMFFFDPPYDYEHYTDLLSQCARLFPSAALVLEASVRKKIVVPEMLRLVKERKIGETMLLFFQSAGV